MSVELVEMEASTVAMRNRLEEMEEKINIAQQFFRKVMVEGQDYGIIPGTDKPTLFKAGAEKLCELYGYAPTIKEVREEKDNETGFARCLVIVSLYKKGTDELVAEGVGEANTMEDKFRWRWVPEWELPPDVNVSGLRHREKTAKNGRKYKLYRLENESPWSLWNTVLKMAKKRALIDAVLSATRLSGIFTQDAEDLEIWIETESVEIDNEGAEPAPGTKSTSEPKGSPPTGPKRSGSGRKLTTNQIQILRDKAKDKGLGDEALCHLAGEVTGKERLEDLTTSDFNDLIEVLKQM